MLTKPVNARFFIIQPSDFFSDLKPNKFLQAVIEKNALNISIRHNQ